MSDSQNWNYHNPVKVVCASLECLAQHVAGQHFLLVTTPGFVRRGVVSEIRKILPHQKITVWDGVKPNPDLHDLDEACANYRQQNIDGVIGLGGGSALDAAKVLANLLPAPADVTLQKIFCQDVAFSWSKRLALIAIPTTSGTGSEVTPFATVWDHTAHKKYSLAGQFVYPDVALMDASLTLTLDAENTLYPALDTISHALESMWNKNCTPISKAFALQAISLVVMALPGAIKDLQKLEARKDLQVASLLAGMAISQTRTAIAHSISYPLTSHFNIPHGLACSFTLPILLKLNGNRMAVTESERILFSQLTAILTALPLNEYIRKYASKDAILELKSEMITLGRSDNYNGVDLNGIEAVLEHALAVY